MAKIIKVGSQNPTFTSSKIANPFKTARKAGATDPFEKNPFMYSNFEGTTLPFADVFEGFKPSFKGGSKLKMVAASVTGSMTKLRNSITEPIVNFAKRVHSGATAAWNYAVNTNVSDLPGVRTVVDVLNTPISELSAVKAMNEALSTAIHVPAIDGLSETMANMGRRLTDNMSAMRENMASKMEFLNKDITVIGRAIADRCSALSINRAARISAEMPVAELEQLWKNEIELAEVGA